MSEYNALDELQEVLISEGREELANDIAILRYKAGMWDKYNKEKRIDDDLKQAIEITEIIHQNEITLEEMWDWCTDFQPADERERTFHDFPSEAQETVLTKDASGATYTGYDDEDIPGEARKGEN